MCELEDVYHTPCGHWGSQRFIHSPCIRSHTTSTGHILPCHDKDINGMSNSKESCSACKLASVISLDFNFDTMEPVFPPSSIPTTSFGAISQMMERNGSVSSESSVESTSSIRSIRSIASARSESSTSSTGSERPTIRLKSLSAGKIHWIDGVGKGKGLNWFWFGLGRGRWGDDVLKVR
ncbi:hypothetical protein Vi05172_g9701 [Venturia inaequalis]|nr:hypothetical protein Vi05172_g9701 [Venturia inaequalis]